MITAGLDIGTRTAKAVLLDDDRILASAVRPVDDAINRIYRSLLAAVSREAGIGRRRIKGTGITGYGSRYVKRPDRRLAGPLCIARAVYHLSPAVRTVVDIGGLVSRVVQMAEDGRVVDYLENDKCASGSGRFLEMIAEALEIPLERLGPVSLTAARPLTLSSQCVVFAESEVISHVNAAETPADILAGVHRAIAERTASLAKKTALIPPVAITGGVAKNTGVISCLRQSLAVKCQNLSIDPQLISGLGAALLVGETIGA